MACGLCAPSATISGDLPSTSSRPGHSTFRSPASMAFASTAAPASASASATATAQQALSIWCRPSRGDRTVRLPSGPETRNVWPSTSQSKSSASYTSSTLTIVAPFARHASSRTAIADGSCGATTTVAPGLMMPALSRAMASTVSPSTCVWSSETGVMTQTSGRATMFVASSVPPSPTSSTWNRRCDWTKQRKAMAVSASKVVTRP